ncbi:MAG: DHA2 family efflux MFS transporter permease subunit [Bdellovibrionia bacterium]
MSTSQAAPERASKKQWIAVFGALLGAFMAILDISITNASMQDIQGGLSAALDEGAWISTAYLVAEIIVIPLTGYFARIFSLKKYLLWNAVIFIAASMMCGFASSLPAMILFRVLQGFAGGTLIPISVSIILTHLPKSQQPTGLALFGLSATFAPCIGPTIGGWLTVNYSWPYIFFINLFPGMLLFGLIAYALEEAPMQLHLLKDGDWFGIASMAAALGSLTVVLEEGVREDWWGSNMIIILSWVFAISFTAFVYHELTTKTPFINLRLLKRRNFLLATLMATVLGYGLYGSIFMLPYFLASVRKMDALQIGQIIMWSGLPQLFILPFIPKLVQRFDNRALLGFGLSLFATSALMNSGLTRDWGYDQFFWSQIIRAIGQPFVITPLSTIAYFGIEPSEIGSASGLNNMMRNLGGSLGIGTLGAIFDHQYHLHFTRLAEATSRFSGTVQEQLAYRHEVLGVHSPVAGIKQAVATVYGSMNKEAFVMSFGDCFMVIALMVYFGAFLVLFTKRPQAGAGSEASH